MYLLSITWGLEMKTLFMFLTIMQTVPYILAFFPKFQEGMKQQALLQRGVLYQGKEYLQGDGPLSPVFVKIGGFGMLLIIPTWWYFTGLDGSWLLVNLGCTVGILAWFWKECYLPVLQGWEPN